MRTIDPCCRLGSRRTRTADGGLFLFLALSAAPRPSSIGDADADAAAVSRTAAERDVSIPSLSLLASNDDRHHRRRPPAQPPPCPLPVLQGPDKASDVVDAARRKARLLLGRFRLGRRRAAPVQEGSSRSRGASTTACTSKRKGGTHPAPLLARHGETRACVRSVQPVAAAMALDEGGILKRRRGDKKSGLLRQRRVRRMLLMRNDDHHDDHDARIRRAVEPALRTPALLLLSSLRRSRRTPPPPAEEWNHSCSVPFKLGEGFLGVTSRVLLLLVVVVLDNNTGAVRLHPPSSG
jgi:hypothetical protein